MIQKMSHRVLELKSVEIRKKTEDAKNTQFSKMKSGKVSDMSKSHKSTVPASKSWIYSEREAAYSYDYIILFVHFIHNTPHCFHIDQMYPCRTLQSRSRFECELKTKLINFCSLSVLNMHHSASQCRFAFVRNANANANANADANANAKPNKVLSVLQFRRF